MEVLQDPPLNHFRGERGATVMAPCEQPTSRSHCGTQEAGHPQTSSSWHPRTCSGALQDTHPALSGWGREGATIMAPSSQPTSRSHCGTRGILLTPHNLLRATHFLAGLTDPHPKPPLLRWLLRRRHLFRRAGNEEKGEQRPPQPGRREITAAPPNLQG